MGELEGKVAIVTGAGRRRSIGYSTSMALAELGADPQSTYQTVFEAMARVW